MATVNNQAIKTMSIGEFDRIVADAKRVIYNKYTYLSETANDIDSRTVRASIEFTVEMLKRYHEQLEAYLQQSRVNP